MKIMSKYNGILYKVITMKYDSDFEIVKKNETGGYTVLMDEKDILAPSASCSRETCVLIIKDLYTGLF